MSDEELTGIVAPLVVTCARHTSNLLVDWGAKGELAYLKVALSDSLSTFESFDRITADITSLLRAAGKEFDFRSQATYPKGDAVTYFYHWLQDKYPGRLVLNSFRSQLGGRQDHKLAAAFELWWNRDLFAEFLIERSAQEKNVSKLRSALESNLFSMEVVGALTARSVLWDKIFEPLRWMSASNDLANEGWTPLDMAPVYEAVKDIVDRAKVDGAVLLNADLDVFASIASPAYVKYKEELLAEQKALPNGKTAVWRQQVRDELYDPKDLTNADARDFTVKLLEVWCGAISVACSETAVKDYINADGKYSAANQTAAMKAKAEGSYRNNDKLTESVFGMLKEYVRNHRGVGPAVAAGLISARKQGVFGDGKEVAQLGTRRRSVSTPPSASSPSTSAPFRLASRSEKEIAALMSMVRKKWKKYHKADVDQVATQRRLNHKRGEAAAAKLMASVEKKMQGAWELVLNHPLDNAVTIEATVKAKLHEASLNTRIKVDNKENPAIDYVWTQLKIYFSVYGLKQFKIQKTGTPLGELKNHLIENVRAIEGSMPEEPVVPTIKSKAVKVLGKLTPQGAQGSAARAAKAQAAHTAARAKALTAKAVRAAEQSKGPKRRKATKRARQVTKRAPVPVFNKGLTGQALEFVMEYEVDLSETEDDLVGTHIKKKFDGKDFIGVVVSKFEGQDGDLFEVQYEDGDREHMGELEVFHHQVRAVGAPVGTLTTLRPLYGEIVDVKTKRVKAGKSKKTTNKALLYIRWDEDIFDDDTDEALEWVEVQPKLHGTNGKGGWEIVPVRECAAQGGMEDDGDEGGDSQGCDDSEDDDSGDADDSQGGSTSDSEEGSGGESGSD